MTVRIKLFGFLAHTAGQSEIGLQTQPGSSVADLVRLAAERLGPDFRRALLDRHGNLQGGLEIVLNGQHISACKISDFFVWDDSELAILPLVGGG